MYCSNCGAEVKGNFCSKCGAKIEEEIKKDTPPISQAGSSVNTESKLNKDAQPNILIRSENCTELVEERKKANDKGLNQILGSISFVVILVMFSPAIIALLEDKKLSQVDSVPLPVVFIMMAILVVFWVLVSKAGKKFNAVYNQYKQYCSTEVLIVEDGKVFGSTAKGSLTLKYDQIGSVTFSPNVYSPESKTPIIPNDILRIKDIAGNEFVFYSFRNCKELKTIIDMKLGGEGIR